MRILLPSLVVAFLCQLAIQSMASGQTVGKPAISEPIITNEYAIFPVTTELQRELLENDAMELCVFINGSAFRKVEKVDRFLPAFEKLQKQLQDQPKANETGVVFRCIDSYVEGEPSEALGQRLEALSKTSEEVGYYAGYLNVKTSRTYTGDFDWNKFIAKAKDATNSNMSGEEEPTGNDRVQVVRVRTMLSHLLVNADSVVSILSVVRGPAGFPEEFIPDLQKYLPRQDPPKGTMLLNVRYSKTAAPQVDGWIENIEGRKEFARRLGFEYCNVSPSPTEEADRFTQGPANNLRMQISVVDPAGKLVPNPHIEFRTRPQMNVRTTVGPDVINATIEGRPNWFNFTIKQPGYVPYYGQWDTRFHGTVLPTEFTAMLHGAWRVGGVVVNDQGEPVVGAEIHPSVPMTSRPGDDLQIHTGDRFTADDEGRWSYDNAPDSEDSFSVEISHPEYSPNWHQLARSKYEIKKDELPTAQIPLERAVTIRGRITDADGQPVSGALVRSQFSNIERQATSDGDGKFEMSGCGAGVARVVFSAKGKAMQLAEVDVNANMEPLAITMQPGGHVRVQVLDREGKPVPKARVFFQRWEGHIDYFEFDNVNQYADEKGVWEWNEAPLEEFHADICPPDGMQLTEQPLQAREEEYVFHTYPELTVSGNVTDAATGKPVELFQAVPGEDHGGTEPNWHHHYRRDFKDGQYMVNFDRSAAGHFVRIEADGYRPRVSRKINSDEGAVTLAFELEPQQNVETVLLTPAGQPVAGAQAYVARGGDQVMLHNGVIRTDPAYTRALELAVAEDGSTHFPLQEGEFQIIVSHPDGFALWKSGDGPVPARITLAPWSALSGTLRLSATAAASAEIKVYQSLSAGRDDAPAVLSEYEASTDQAGHFQCARVIPGKAYIVYNLEGSTGQATSSQRVPVKLEPGETTEVNIGGTGRPVIGKLVPYVGFAEEPQWRSAWVRVNAGQYPLPDQLPPTDGERANQRKEWAESEAGQNWSRAHEAYIKVKSESPTFTAMIDRDGSFRIDDVPAGEYELSVRFNEYSVGMISRHPFMVPPIEGERSDEPLDLGEIQLEKK